MTLAERQAALAHEAHEWSPSLAPPTRASLPSPVAPAGRAPSPSPALALPAPMDVRRPSSGAGPSRVRRSPSLRADDGDSDDDEDDVEEDVKEAFEDDSRPLLRVSERATPSGKLWFCCPVC